MKKRILTGLVIVSVASVSLMAFGPNHKGKRLWRKPPIVTVLKQLDLTDEQKATLKALREEQKGKREAFRNEIRTTIDLNTIFTPQGFNKEKFIAVATDTFQKVIVERADFIEKVYAVLDDDQRAELVEQLEKLRDKRGDLLERLEEIRDKRAK